MITKSQAIKEFLNQNTHSDLAALYNINQECQINVAQDGGTRIDGEYRGKKWHGWTDNHSVWKSFRIPYKANSDPEYDDDVIKFNLKEHVEAIGLTGWDWKNRQSKWVAFDFDSMVEHKTGLLQEELENIKNAACGISWVTVRKSTSGNGLHLYVFIDESPEVNNHNEHAALGRAILGLMSAITGYDFKTKVDSCGGVMWIWHRKMLNTDGLKLIKQGDFLKEIPLNWKDHLKVISGKRRKNLPQVIEDQGNIDLFDEISGQRPHIPLDDNHKRLIDWLKENDKVWWWDQDNHMLVTHTLSLKEAHTALSMKGFFETESKGTTEWNCFCFPLRYSGWVIRRFTMGVQEHVSWDQDGNGWTRCYYNREPDLITASRSLGGLEDPTGGFIFREAEVALKAAQLLGVYTKIDTVLSSRKTKLKQHKDGRLIIEIDHDSQDLADKMPGWLVNKNKWIKIFNTQVPPPNESEVISYDDILRHIVTESGEDYGWAIKTDGIWRTEPLTHIKIAMKSLGYNDRDVNSILGNSIFKCWKLVNRPFQPEYPGEREWNRRAAQLRFTPASDTDNLNYPTWMKILNHCGLGLNVSLANNHWAKANGIITGADYLKCWISSLIKEPTEPLPYIFFYSQQQSTGKSIFHEALSLLFTKGYKRADAALTSSSGFNGELEGAILCVIEETDLRRNKNAYNLIKDWVTAKDILIHRKGETPYHTPNTTHWIQCANDHQACPIFPGDTRITMVYVPPINPIDMIPKKQLLIMLEKEAPHFISELLNLDLPPSSDRLNVPCIETEEKSMVQAMNRSHLETFISEKCRLTNGQRIKFSDFHEKFIEWLDPNEVRNWSKIRTGRELPPSIVKGRDHGTGQWYIGNISWSSNQEEDAGFKYVVNGDYLEEQK